MFNLWKEVYLTARNQKLQNDWVCKLVRIWLKYENNKQLRFPWTITAATSYLGHWCSYLALLDLIHFLIKCHTHPDGVCLCDVCRVELTVEAREKTGELYCLRCHDKMGIPICGACRSVALYDLVSVWTMTCRFLTGQEKDLVNQPMNRMSWLPRHNTRDYCSGHYLNVTVTTT